VERRRWAVPIPESVPHVAEVRVHRAAQPLPRAVAVLIEVPHGAAGHAEYAAVGERLRSPLPASLVDFFHVNTDAGAFEVAEATARLLCARGVASLAVIVRSRIPRTFIDCNRVLGASREAYQAGGVTPGVPPWITDPADHAALVALYDAYQAVVKAALEEVGTAGGRILLLHTYAPRSVGVEVSENIVADLRAAYAPGTLESWPLRPEVDLIQRTPDGTRTVSEADATALSEAFAAEGLTVADGETYPMHPVTTAWGHVHAFPGRAACVEVRRDLLTEAFIPFVQVVPDAERCQRVARALAAWVGAIERA
jgi:predicted N-formylglutamate amidohydrolase